KAQAITDACTKRASSPVSRSCWSSRTASTLPSGAISIWPDSCMLISACLRTPPGPTAAALPAASSSAAHMPQRCNDFNMTLSLSAMVRRRLYRFRRRQSRQPQRARIGRRIRELATGETGLQAAPPARIEQFAMRLAHRLHHRTRQAHEQREALGKHIVGRDMEPWLGGHGFHGVARLRPVAEVAVGDPAQFVVVVEHHAAMAGYAKVLQQ